MPQKTAILILSFFLFSCGTEYTKPPENGFDAACRIFETAETKNLDPEALGVYLSDRLNNMPDLQAVDDVRVIYHALFNADPAKRYEIFKESAEMTLNRNWDCAAMKRIYG